METFETIFSRIKQETEIKTISKLAEAIGRKQPTISESRKKGVFQPQWAYEIELKTGLTTRWIMTGEGPKRHQDAAAQPKTPPPPSYFTDLEAWAKETSEGGSLRWVENQIDRLFPDFKVWREKKATDETTQNQIDEAM